MLADKKRREKWSTNPMGNFWSKDENKFGQKMLEKMGWSPGTGLGARGQGATDVIKIHVKNDTLGLGSKRDSDKELWTKQLVNFDSLLSDLNGVSEKYKKEPDILKSLEEKSKSSRRRVHYHKYTRNKDVSKYSSKDLNSILPLNHGKEQIEEKPTANNMYAYFNTKTNNPYKQHENTDSTDNVENILLDNVDASEETLDNVSCDENVRGKKKKRKNVQVEEEDVQDELITSKKKKKKKKKEQQIVNEGKLEESNNDNVLNNVNMDHEDQNLAVSENGFNIIPKKKKKKKKHVKQDIHDLS